MGTVGFVIVTAEFRREGKRLTAFCPELGTATFGRSLPEAERKLREAIELQLNTLEELGQREAFFKEHNISFSTDHPEGASVLVRAATDSFVKAILQPIPIEAVAA